MVWCALESQKEREMPEGTTFSETHTCLKEQKPSQGPPVAALSREQGAHWGRKGRERVKNLPTPHSKYLVKLRCGFRQPGPRIWVLHPFSIMPDLHTLCLWFLTETSVFIGPSEKSITSHARLQGPDLMRWELRPSIWFLLLLRSSCGDKPYASPHLAFKVQWKYTICLLPLCFL